ncbi:NmrA-like domain [Dillenia turbinata]|uniref:NmrA-like domain n=1 Tax=Dillenia turbinata TaxID=194707 RepID=A0AAN8ZNM5_9MAGN
MGDTVTAREMAGEATRILIIGGTGYIGSYFVRASILLGYPTYIYSRHITANTNPTKIHMLKEFESIGVNVFYGHLDENEKLVEVIKQVDVVISAVAYPQVLDQFNIIEAIKVAGNVKRFLPSDFGCEEDRVAPLPPFQTFLDKKRKIRRAIEAANIPYTFVPANCFGAHFVNLLLHPHEQSDEIVVYGTGKAKAVLNYEEDIAWYTIKVAVDPRTCNRVVFYRPPKNIVSQFELISLWEKKIGRSFKVVPVPEEVVMHSEVLPSPKNIPVAILHSVFIKGELMSFELEEDDMEASKLYPDFEYTTIDQLLDIFLSNPPKPAFASFE